jgi:nucleoside-diphosphate-sugar epimerase
MYLMGYRIFLAGASGAIGQRLIPILRDAGHQVTGTTRTQTGAEKLGALGIAPVMVDVLDASALLHAVLSSRPEIVIHQLTALSGADASPTADTLLRNAHVRKEGTENLVTAALAAGARKLNAQSIAWAYAPGREPHAEDDPLDRAAIGTRGISVAGVVALEQSVLQSPPLTGIVLRYGQLYGPGTWNDEPTGALPLHVDAAAYAAFLAVGQGVSGIFNIAEPNNYVTTEKASAGLAWDANFRLPNS